MLQRGLQAGVKVDLLISVKSDSLMHLHPQIDSLQGVSNALSERGFCLVSAPLLARMAQLDLQDLMALGTYWNALQPDHFLKDQGRYRLRRHDSLIVSAGQAQKVPHRAHWQSLDYNALHGGIERLFEPIDEGLSGSPVWQQLIQGVASSWDVGQTPRKWYTEAHQFRINTVDGIGRPTPEGAHRDGVDYVAVILVARENIKGGETRIFELSGNEGLRFTLEEPWSMLLLDDHRIVHETTPIQSDGGLGHRDTLVLTFRLGGFQEPQLKTAP